MSPLPALNMRPATLKLHCIIVVFRGSVADGHGEILPSFDTRDPRRKGRLRRALRVLVCHKLVDILINVQLLLSFLLSFGGLEPNSWLVRRVIAPLTSFVIYKEL